MLLLNPIKLCRYYPGDHPRGHRTPGVNGSIINENEVA